MGRYFRAALAIAMVLAIGACNRRAPRTNAPADIDAINALRSAFITALNAGDGEAYRNFYTEDAVSQPNHDKTTTGRDAIVEGQKAMFSQFAVKAEIVPEETRTLAGFGFDRGHFTMTLTPKAGGEAITQEGRYLVLLQRDSDGTWKVWRDIDNSTLPMPMPPTPAATEKK